MVDRNETPEQREARRAKQREASRRYRERNAEKVRAADRARSAEWRRRNPDYGKQYYEANREQRLANARRWRDANPEAMLENLRRWKREHPDRARELDRLWRAANPERAIELVRRGRARRNGVQFDYITPERLIAKLAFWGNVCWMCGGDATEVDHVKPISKGGSHLLANIRPACGTCNMKKRSRWFGVAALDRFRRAA